MGAGMEYFYRQTAVGSTGVMRLSATARLAAIK
jgi:hypothetical protein